MVEEQLEELSLVRVYTAQLIPSLLKLEVPDIREGTQMVSRILRAGYSQVITLEVRVAPMDNSKPLRKTLKLALPCFLKP